MHPNQQTSYLEQTEGPNSGTIPLEPDLPCRFGRETDNTVVVTADLVSRYHAVIDCRGPADYVLTDLGSRNGTLLNGSPIRRPTRLNDGHEIEIGGWVFIFRQQREPGRRDTQPPPIPTVAEVSLEMITVLVTDIRGYTDWARHVDAEMVATFMAALFAEADEILSRQRAWAHKYIGDAVMSIWRHGRISDAGAVRSALTSAAELFAALDRVNSRLALPVPLTMAAGVNTGLASLGNLGSDRSVDYTALGDSVNKTFRLESATRTIDCDLLLGNAAYVLLEPKFRDDRFRNTIVSLKGYSEPEVAWATSAQELKAVVSGFPVAGLRG
jgi:adenylate cyclase